MLKRPKYVLKGQNQAKDQKDEKKRGEKDEVAENMAATSLPRRSRPESLFWGELWHSDFEGRALTLLRQRCDVKLFSI